MTKKVVLHSALPPDAVAEALRRSMDEGHRTLFSLSGYRGSRPVLGQIRGDTFRLQKRRYSRNDFAGQFYGQFRSEPGGTRIEGYFDAPRWARNFMKFWLAAVVVIGTPVFVSTLSDLTRSHHMSGDRWVGIVVPPALVLFGTILPRFGRVLGRSGEGFLLEHLQRTLSARIEELDPTRVQ
jgi:hypothetical protein